MARNRGAGQAASECRCARLCVGMEVTEHRNWNPDCPEHGTESAWWRSPEQVEARRQQNERLRDLQRQARERRREAAASRAAEHAPDGPIGPNPGGES